MLQRLLKTEMCWKWQQGAFVSWLPPFPTRTNQLTLLSINLRTYKQYGTNNIEC